MGFDLLVGALVGAAASLLIVGPVHGPTAWFRAAMVSAAPRSRTWVYLWSCYQCVAVWTGLLIGVPAAVAGDTAQLVLAVPAAAVLILQFSQHKLGGCGGAGAGGCGGKGRGMIQSHGTDQRAEAQASDRGRGDDGAAGAITGAAADSGRSAAAGGASEVPATGSGHASVGR